MQEGFMLKKCLSDKKKFMAAKETIGDGGGRNTPTASFLTKIGKMQSAVCRLCNIAREA